MPKHPRASLFGLMMLHASINSGGYLIVKLGLSEFSPLAFAFWRFIFGLCTLSVMGFLLKAWPHIEKKDWPRFLLLALVAVPGNQLLYLSGMRYTVPSHASLIYATTAAFALLLSALMGYEKPQRLKMVAIVIAVAGVALVVSNSPTVMIGSENFFGDVLVTLSMFAWAAYTVLAKPMVDKYGAVRATLAALTTGSIIGLPFLIYPALTQDYSILTWRGWTGSLYTGIMVTGVTYTLWFAMLKRVVPSQVAILTTPQPVITTTLSVLLLHEVIGITLITGGLLVIGGVLLMQAPALIRDARNSSILSRLPRERV